MKRIKLLFIGLGFFAATQIDAQPIFSEDFNGGNSLSNWTLINVDGLTPAANVSYVNDAWVVREDFDTTGVSDSVAVSTSWYSPAGTSNDYLITPSIILTPNNFLFYDAKAQDAAFPDGYELRISNTTPTVAGLNANPALFTVNAENASWTRRTFDLSAYAGDTVYIGWRNNSNDQFLLLVDNILIDVVDPIGVEMNDLTINSTQTSGSAVSITGSIKNTGANALTSVVINYNVNGGTTVFMDTLSINVPSFQTASFSHSTSLTASNAGMFTDLTVWTSFPNGIVDPNTTNDTLSTQFFVNNGMSASKNVLLEEFTTAPCQFCPDGTVVVEQILTNNPAVIAVGEHACFGTDAMTIPEASTYCNAFSGGAPTATIDRTLFSGESQVGHGRGTWAANANTQANLSTPVSVALSGTYNSSTRATTINVAANYVDFGLPGDLRVTLFVVEDSVTGSGSGFDQVNAYNNIAGHPYAGAGNPIVGFQHRHVLRDVYPSGNAWGQPGVIPMNPTPNGSYTQSFTFNTNASWKEKDVSFVAFVSYFDADVTKREVVNVEELKLSTLITTNVAEIVKDEASLTVYPNPTSDFTTISFDLSKSAQVKLELRDITGKLVSSNNYGQLTIGKQNITVDANALTNGIYFATITLDNKTVTKKISVNK